MLEELRQCEVCPFRCKVNRLEGKIGRCGCNDKIKIALASLHYYEEPCISGNNGSGTVFFSNCNLNCLFCQNYKISQEGKGREVSFYTHQVKSGIAKCRDRMKYTIPDTGSDSKFPAKHRKHEKSACSLEKQGHFYDKTGKFYNTGNFWGRNSILHNAALP